MVPRREQISQDFVDLLRKFCKRDSGKSLKYLTKLSHQKVIKVLQVKGSTQARIEQLQMFKNRKTWIIVKQV